jgi:hypothetical protein
VGGVENLFQQAASGCISRKRPFFGGYSGVPKLLNCAPRHNASLSSLKVASAAGRHLYRPSEKADNGARLVPRCGKLFFISVNHLTLLDGFLANIVRALEVATTN